MSFGAVLRVIQRGFPAAAMLALLSGPKLAAQAGLSTGVAQIALVARSAPQAAIQRVSPALETGRNGSTKEVSVSVGLAANTGYRLVVVGTPAANGSRLWVRGVDGEFQELTPGTAVTVARDGRIAGTSEREVSYRTETSVPDGMKPLPVRYEIRVEPTI